MSVEKKKTETEYTSVGKNVNFVQQVQDLSRGPG